MRETMRRKGKEKVRGENSKRLRKRETMNFERRVKVKRKREIACWERSIEITERIRKVSKTKGKGKENIGKRCKFWSEIKRRE